MPSRNKIATRLVLAIGLSTTLIFLLMLAGIQWQARQIIEQEAIHQARNLTKSVSDQIATILDDTTWVVERAAMRLSADAADDAAVHRLLRDILLNNPQIYGSTAAFEPDARAGTTGPYAPYAYRREQGNGEGITFRQLEDSYDYLEQDWYRVPRRAGQGLWSEPYFDLGGGDSLMTTFSVPFYAGTEPTKRLAGIVTADIELDWLAGILSGFRILDHGYAFVLSREGRTIFHPVRSFIMRETAASIAEKTGDARFRDIGREMTAGHSGFIPYTTPEGAKARLFYGPIAATGWSLGIVFPENELFWGATWLTVVAAAIGLAGILLVAFVIMVMSRTITRPLKDLALVAGRISNGEFDIRPPAATARDEVGDLSRALIRMQQDLQQHIGDLLQATSARERIEGELAGARDLQMALVPRIPRPFPGRDVVDLSASIEPAREVGGDFYDWFWLDERRLCLAIADVSGKGVPAALFMAVSHTLLKSLAAVEADPAQVLRTLNTRLAGDNEQSMFVTLFYAVVDIETKLLTYVNAGHNPPILIPRDGAPRFLTNERQLVIGAVGDYHYRNDTLSLAAGDRLLLYTDGVTEAINPDGAFQGEAALLAAAEQLRALDATGITAGVISATRIFANGTAQSDDITVMTLQLLGS